MRFVGQMKERRIRYIFWISNLFPLRTYSSCITLHKIRSDVYWSVNDNPSPSCYHFLLRRSLRKLTVWFRLSPIRLGFELIRLKLELIILRPNLEFRAYTA